MLSTAPTFGLAVISSSWKLDSSMTTRSFGLMIGSTLSSTSPMLPPTQVRCPARLKISPISVVVVVLPALPGDADHRRGAALHEQLGVVGQRHAVAQRQLQNRQVQRHAAGDADQIRAFEQDFGMPAEHELDAGDTPPG